MKKKLFLALIIVCLLVSATVFCVSAITSASEDVTLEIKACNLTFGASIYIDYAVATTGVSDADSVELLIWEMAQDSYVKGSEKWSYSPDPGTKNIAGVPCKVFTFDDIIARRLADDFYAVAYVKEGDTEYYSEPLKYGVLKYAYERLGLIPGTPSSSDNYKALLTQMLEYGAAVQTNFNYNTDRLADAKYYLVSVEGGTLPDGFDWGLYKENDKVTISAPEKNAEGGTFAGWVDGNGNKVYDKATEEITVTAKNETYTATYVKYSEGLEFDSNGDGTCCLLGMGDCNDTVLVIPPVSPEGDTVTEIESSAFAEEPITSVSLPGTITDIGRKAFNGCTSLTDVYYDGTAEEWANVDIGTGNEPILNATMHFASATTYTVTFVDWDGTVLSTVSIASGATATAPAAPTREGYTFVGWSGSFANVTSNLTITAQYNEPPKFVVSTTSTSAGKTDVVVTVSIENNPGILGMVLKLNYDDTVLTLTKATKGSALYSHSLTKPGQFANGCNFVMDTMELEEEDYEDGIILTLSFTIKGSAPMGSYSIEISYEPNAIKGGNYEPLNHIVVENGIIIVE